MNKKINFLSVVVPCYNEQDGIHELHKRVTAVTRKYFGESYELILVNDGSKDDTWGSIKNISSKDKNIVGVNLSKNHGHQLALTAGLTVSKGDLIFVLDADLQDPPELLPEMLEKLREGADVAYGQRVSRSGESRFKLLTAYLFYRFINALSDVYIPNDTGDFRLMSRRVCDLLISMPESHRFVRGMVAWIGFRQEPVTYERSSRFAGETGYPFSKMLKLAIDAITGFSIRPLKLASYLGFAMAIVSFFLFLTVLYGYSQGETVKGWTSLMVVQIFLGGVQLIVIGLMGEYVGRLYIQSKNRPLFLIDEIVKGDDN